MAKIDKPVGVIVNCKTGEKKIIRGLIEEFPLIEDDPNDPMKLKTDLETTISEIKIDIEKIKTKLKLH